MTMFDPLFVLPLFNGLLLAGALPIVGAYLRLRGEWLASLAIGQAAAAGIVITADLGVPTAVGAVLAATLAGPVKTLLGSEGGDDTYGLMLLAGWSVALLMAANTTHGQELAQALLQGQIYFTGTSHLVAIAIAVLMLAALLPRISQRILVGRFFPEHFVANGIANPKHALIFDMLVAATVALTASVLGVTGAFALAFLPPWMAFRFARGWRRTLAWSAGLGACGYLVSFALAIAFDQPGGPVLVATLLAMSAARALVKA
jgi:zinc/manganese transport system permease protein